MVLGIPIDLNHVAGLSNLETVNLSDEFRILRQHRDQWKKFCMARLRNYRVNRMNQQKLTAKCFSVELERALHSIEPPRNEGVYLKSIQTYHTSAVEDDLNGMIHSHNDKVNQTNTSSVESLAKFA